ncbi:MAG: DNA translocase FtsK [Firmicutes bacterium]|nr:DNA translocase FtsK [Bacillota bacterium]
MLEQPIYRARGRAAKPNRAGIIVMVAAIVILLMMVALPGFFVSVFFFAVFGVYAFALAKAAFFIGLALHKRKKFRLNKRYVALSGMLIFCVFTAMHIAFTHTNLGEQYFGEYLAGKWGTQTPGGLVFGIPAYIMHAVFFLEGSLIVLGVKFVIVAAFLTTYIVTSVGENKVIKKLPKIVEEFEVMHVAQTKEGTLDARLEATYQELIEKQSRRQHDRNKSLLGLIPDTDTRRKGGNAVTEYDQPLTMAELPPRDSIDQINQWSTNAANAYNNGLAQMNGAQGAAANGLSPLYYDLGPNYKPMLSSTKAHETAAAQSPLFTPEPYVQPQPYQPPTGLFSQPQPYTPPQTPAYTPPPFTSYPNTPRPDFSDNTPPPPPPPPISIIDRGSSFEMAGRGAQLEIDTSSAKRQKAYKRARYNKPPIDLVRTESSGHPDESEAIAKQELLNNKLKEFEVNAKVMNYIVAPAITRYEIQLATGTRVADVTRLEQDLGYVLGSQNIRIETTIEGKNAIGVEVPNAKVGMVSIKDLLKSQEFMNHKSPLACCIGKNINDEMIVTDLATMPHLLIAGSTGSGKSVMLNTILTSLVFRAHPDDVKLLLVDMKRVELNMYNDIPHMLVPKALSEVAHTINALNWMADEMRRRYELLEQNNVNNIIMYQSLPAYQSGTLERMPYILMVIDEAADLFARGKKDVEEAIKSLAALARACGIHIILATQRPSTDVITGVIKANFPSRIAFKVGSMHDSKTIMDGGGAEKLVGRGDMLFMKEGRATRVQGAFIENDEARRVMCYIRDNNEAEFDTAIEDIIKNGPPVNNNDAGITFGDESKLRAAGQSDPAFLPILKWIVRDDNMQRTVSISNIQRQFQLGFSRAGKIIDTMTSMGYVAASNGSKARDVIITREEVERLYGE